jgi:hypothetical protein
MIDPDLTCDVLGNLEKLTQADALFEWAGELLAEGHFDEAMACYDLIARLVPGSRFDGQIAEVLCRLEGFGDATEAATEEEELPPPSVDEESRIEVRLKAPVTVIYTDTPLKRIIEDLRTSQGLNITVDEAALAEENIRLDKPVSVKLEQVCLKSVLTLMLRPSYLTYIVQGEEVQITTEKRARGKPVIATYPVADLVVKDPKAKCGPEASEEETLIRLIVNTVAPRTWSEKGGDGTVEYYPLAHSLVVNQTPDVQDQVADLLTALRRLEDLRCLEEKKAGTAEQVAGLMKACRLAAEAGETTHAADLARQVYALDSQKAMSDLLIAKMYRLSAASKCEECEDGPPCPACPAVSEAGPVALRPILPPVDPRMVDAFDGLLKEVESAYPLCQAGEAQEAAEYSLTDLMDALLESHGCLMIGVDIEGNVTGDLEVRTGGKVYHAILRHGCFAVWRTTDASQ